MVKILVAGDVEGRYAETFARVAKLDAKSGPFDALFCVGAFRASPDDAVPAAPIPTFVLGGAADEAVGENVKTLGSCGVATVVERKGGAGAKHLSVAVATAAASVAALDDAAGAPGFMGVDVLLTDDWPRGIDVGADDDDALKELEAMGVRPHACGSEKLAAAVVACRPRYHFAGSRDAFWARAPFRHAAAPPSVRKTHVCRFVALGRAAASKDKRRKWLHAVDVDPVPYAPLASLVAEPAGCGDSPFVCFQQSERPVETLAREADAAPASKPAGSLRWNSDGDRGPKRRRVDDGSSTTLFVGGLPPYVDDAKLGEVALKALGENAPKACRASGRGFGFLDFAARDAAAAALGELQASGLEVDGRRLTVDWGESKTTDAPSAQRYAEDARRHCWFCLASPDCETHLVASIGEQCYTCMPKGPLVDAHALVVPVAHAAHRADLDGAALEEFDKTSDDLAATFRAKLDGAHAVAFERVADTKKGVYHIHRQIIPMPRRGDGDAKKLAEDFQTAASRSSFGLDELDPSKPFQPSSNERFFVVDIYDGDTGAKTRLARVEARDAPGRFAPLHFGRDLLAAALGEPHKAHWKACEKSQAEEVRLCDALKGLVGEETSS